MDFDFIAWVLAIIAIVLAVKMRSRVIVLERQMTLVNGQLALGPEGAAAPSARPADQPSSTPAADDRRSPLEQFVSKPAEPAAPPERIDEPAVDQVSASAPAAPPPPYAAPEAPTKSFEERFGANWVAWIGGLALALGGIFMVQYSIEAGLIGPGVRTFLGGLLSAALIAAGEWTRRREFSLGLAQVPAANIPSILTAAGTTVAFATIYAAYALYGFLSPAAAFILLAIVALATLAAALLHGPWLAALGQVGAFVAPMLVTTPEPNYWALYLYLAVVTAGSFALARARLWRWLAITAVAFAVLWAFPGIVAAPTPVAIYLAVGFALVAALLVSGLLYGPDAGDNRIDPVSSGALAAFLAAVAILATTQHHDALTLTVFTLLTAATVAIAWRTEAAVAAVPVAGALAVLVIADWAIDFQWHTLVAPGGPTAGLVPEPQHAFYGAQLAIGFAYAALFAAAGFLAQGRSARPHAPIIWAATGVITSLLILIALYFRIYGFDRSLPFAALALLYAAIFGIATEMLSKREPRPGLPSAAAIFATGCVAALALTLTFALEKGWLTVALALMVPGVAWISGQRRLPWLRTLCAILTGLVIARIGYEPRIVAALDATPIFNWILYGYGVPAIAFWVAGWLLRKRADDAPVRVVDAGAILFTALCGSLEIRHFIYSGDIYYSGAALAEVALQVIGALAMAIGLERLRLRTDSIVHNVASILFAGFAIAGIVLGLLLVLNPWIWGTDVGGVFINLNLLGYAIPAALAATLGLITRDTRPQAYRTIAAVTAVVLTLTYLSFQVALAYHGPRLSTGPVGQAEGYTYSAVWLAFGVVLLLAGVALRSQPVRLCSAAVVTLTIAKVFLLDMAGLTGAWRALSFIGLGLVLLAIARLYQRLLFPPKPRPPQPTEAPAS